MLVELERARLAPRRFELEERDATAGGDDDAVGDAGVAGTDELVEQQSPALAPAADTVFNPCFAHSRRAFLSFVVKRPCKRRITCLRLSPLNSRTSSLATSSTGISLSSMISFSRS